MTFTAKLCVLSLLFLSFQFALVNRADGQDRKGYKGFYYGYCTYHAAQEFDKFAPGNGIDWRGNGGAWLNSAHANGWKTSTDPLDARVGSVIVWKSGGPGHVAIVTDVDEFGITISEMNWRVTNEGISEGGFNRVSTSRLPFTNLNRRRYTFLGYVFPEKEKVIRSHSPLERNPENLVRIPDTLAQTHNNQARTHNTLARNQNTLEENPSNPVRTLDTVERNQDNLAYQTVSPARPRRVISLNVSRKVTGGLQMKAGKLSRHPRP